MAFLGGLVAFLGFLALLVALFGLVRQRVRWTRVIATRRDAAFLLVGALVAMVVGTAISPKQVATTPSAASETMPSAASSTGPQALLAAPIPSAAPSTAAPTPSVTPTVAVAPSSTAPSTPPPAPASSAPAVIAAPAPALTVPTQRSYVAPPRHPAPVHTTTRTRTAPPSTTGAYNGGGTTDTYTNVDGNQVERPDGSSAGASAKCRDGSYSHSQHRSGTCSGHGGVAQWLNP